ncbi:MAG TPA: hypothetical protein VN258_01580 [Mobilitalea sp.]|nr:hypothetical protein [Mobilitalea sp.]
MNEMTHISNSEFNTFQNDIMNQKEKEAFLEHICSCDFCSDQFAAMMSEVVIEAPKDMKANILRASKRPEVQLAIKYKETSKRMQLFIYSLKVGTATVVALLLLLLTMNSTFFSNSSNFPGTVKTDISENQEDKVPLTTQIRDNMDAISNNILNFSNNIINMEVMNNDKKKE